MGDRDWQTGPICRSPGVEWEGDPAGGPDTVRLTRRVEIGLEDRASGRESRVFGTTTEYLDVTAMDRVESAPKSIEGIVGGGENLCFPAMGMVFEPATPRGAVGLIRFFMN